MKNAQLASELHANADLAVVAVVVERCNVVSAGFGKIQYLRYCCILARDNPAIDHPVHLCVGAADFKTSFGRFFAGRPAYDRAII